jgi:hypothetical protein
MQMIPLLALKASLGERLVLRISSYLRFTHKPAKSDIVGFGGGVPEQPAIISTNITIRSDRDFSALPNDLQQAGCDSPALNIEL